MQISFEFFPPQSDRGRANLVRTAQTLDVFQPAFYSVTYGAGGSTRDRTFAAVEALRQAGFSVAPHLSWGEDSRQQVLDLIAAYRRLGIDRLVALRGDIPSGVGSNRQFRHAEELVRLIRAEVAAVEADGALAVEVAAYPEVHPEAPSATADIAFLKRKVDAGASGCITQYFYHADGFFHFRDACVAAGIDVPIVPGVMPIADYAKLARFSAKVGAEIPRWLRLRLDSFDGDDAALGAFGAEVVTAMCERLLRGGVPGLHFYTLNRAAPTQDIVGNLGL